MRSYYSWRHPSWLKDKQTNLLSKECFLRTIKTAFYSHTQWLFWSCFPTPSLDGVWDIILSSPEFISLVAQEESVLLCGHRKSWFHSRLHYWCAASSSVSPMVPHLCMCGRLLQHHWELHSPSYASHTASSLCVSISVNDQHLLSIKIKIYQLSLNGRYKRQPCSFEFTLEVPSKFSNLSLLNMTILISHFSY